MGRPTPTAVQVPPPVVTPLGDAAVCVPPPVVTPSPEDVTRAASRDVADGAVGFVQAVARARSAAASVKRTSMCTSEAFMQLSRNWCTYTRLLHPSRQSRFGTNDGSFGRQDPCW